MAGNRVRTYGNNLLVIAGDSVLGEDAASGSGGNGGNVPIAAGAGDGSGNGGQVVIDGGPAGVLGGGVNGDVLMRTQGTDAPVGIRTTSGFVGTECERLTFANSVSYASLAVVTIVVLGTLDTDGQNLKIDLYVTTVNNADDTEIGSLKFTRTFFRRSGVVAQLAAHQNSFVNNGAPILLDVAISGNDIILRATNDNPSARTFNTAVCWTRQEGGFTS